MIQSCRVVPGLTCPEKSCHAVGLFVGSEGAPPFVSGSAYCHSNSHSSGVPPKSAVYFMQTFLSSGFFDSIGSIVLFHSSGMTRMTCIEMFSDWSGTTSRFVELFMTSVTYPAPTPVVTSASESCTVFSSAISTTFVGTDCMPVCQSELSPPGKHSLSVISWRERASITLSHRYGSIPITSR